MTNFLTKYWPVIRKAARQTQQLNSRAASGFLAGLTYSLKRIRAARALWLHLAELAGVVLVTFGISLWSIPAALIIGGLVLVGVVEVRPHVGQQLPRVPPPVELLRSQAENAAVVLNSDRYGLGAVDADRLADLSPAECERLILAARALGASK